MEELIQEIINNMEKETEKREEQKIIDTLLIDLI